MNFPIREDSIYGCWIWEGETNADGYAMDKGRYAHRLVYETLVGAIPPGMFLDHLCRRRACVRPQHMEPVTQRENDKRRSWSYRVKNIKQCHLCKRNLFTHGRKTPWAGFVCLSCAPP